MKQDITDIHSTNRIGLHKDMNKEEYKNFLNKSSPKELLSSLKSNPNELLENMKNFVKNYKKKDNN